VTTGYDESKSEKSAAEEDRTVKKMLTHERDSLSDFIEGGS